MLGQEPPLRETIFHQTMAGSPSASCSNWAQSSSSVKLHFVPRIRHFILCRTAQKKTATFAEKGILS